MTTHRLVCVIVLLSLLLTSSVWQANTISLRSESLPFTPTEYYIAEVVDQRALKSTIGRWVTAPNQQPVSVNLAGGAAVAIQQFVKQNMRQNTKLRPIAIHIIDCQVTETTAPNRPYTEGKLSFGVVFYFKRNEDQYSTPAKLTEYRTSARYTRPIAQPAVVEQTIRQSLVASLKFFNEFMNRESKRDERLASDIKVTFSEYVQNRSGSDTVFYTPSRILSWNDFLATPRATSRYAAEINPNFAYEGRSSVANGVVTVNLLLKVFMLKSGSWVRDVARNEYSLNHEQRHFEIAKIIAERFKRKIIPDSLTIEDYNSIIQYQFVETYREMSKLQEQYDGETNHGINQAAQARWNQWVDTELQKYGIKK